MAQDSVLLTGTLHDNFFGKGQVEIEAVLQTVLMLDWYKKLPKKLNTWLGENGTHLSGGQIKKLLLAQTLIQHPQLLIADEPTAGIDEAGRHSILNNIKQEYPSLSLLIVSHQRDLQEFADEVVNYNEK